MFNRKDPNMIKQLEEAGVSSSVNDQETIFSAPLASKAAVLKLEALALELRRGDNRISPPSIEGPNIVLRISDPPSTPLVNALLFAPRFFDQLSNRLKPVLAVIIVFLLLYIGIVLWAPKRWWWVVQPF